MTYKITKKQLKETINKELNKFKKGVLSEGVDFDYVNLTVSFNPSHEQNVNTSVEVNPTIDFDTIPGVRTWSIFKRKRGGKLDGNPLLYALKGENGWHFKSIEDRLAIDKQFDSIADKFVQLFPVGATVLIPSSNGLNKYIANKVISKAKNAELFQGLLQKLTTEEVVEMALDPNSKLRQIYNNDFNEMIERLFSFLEKMDKYYDGYFIRHMIKDAKLRDALDFTFKASTEFYAKFANRINGKDILLIDDSISRGQTLKDACKIIKQTYAPKSITILTLLSKSY